MSIDSIVEELRDNYERYAPLTSGDGLVRIDTSDFSAIDYAAIVERARMSSRSRIDQ